MTHMLLPVTGHIYSCMVFTSEFSRKWRNPVSQVLVFHDAAQLTQKLQFDKTGTRMSSTMFLIPGNWYNKLVANSEEGITQY